MKKCLIVINYLSGHSQNVDEQKLYDKFCKDYIVNVVKIRTKKDNWSAEGFDLIVICGGDGTFNYAMNNAISGNTDVIYYSCGTFNECAKAKGTKGSETDKIQLKEYATANKRFFGYVLAAGSFTPLGYIVPPEKKKKLGIFAYLLKVVGQYRVYNIRAKIKADGKCFDDNYTLVMAIDSMRCFGFKFNKMYRPDDGMVHLLLIKSPGKDNFINKVKIFFPMFRAFFIGLKKELNKKNIVFTAVEHAEIELSETVTFNIDGEEATFENKIDVVVKVPQNNVYIGNFDTISK